MIRQQITTEKYKVYKVKKLYTVSLRNSTLTDQVLTADLFSDE